MCLHRTARRQSPGQQFAGSRSDGSTALQGHCAASNVQSSKQTIRSAVLSESGPSNPQPVPRYPDALPSKLYRYAGLVRTETGLANLLTDIADNTVAAPVHSSLNATSANMLLVSRLIATAALYRRESRGAHFRDDHQGTNDTQYRKRLSATQDNWVWTDLQSPPEPVVRQPGAFVTESA